MYKAMRQHPGIQQLEKKLGQQPFYRLRPDAEWNPEQPEQQHQHQRPAGAPLLGKHGRSPN